MKYSKIGKKHFPWNQQETKQGVKQSNYKTGFLISHYRKPFVSAHFCPATILNNNNIALLILIFSASAECNLFAFLKNLICLLLHYNNNWENRSTSGSSIHFDYRRHKSINNSRIATLKNLHKIVRSSLFHSGMRKVP